MEHSCPYHKGQLVEQPYGWRCAFCDYVEYKPKPMPSDEIALGWQDDDDDPTGNYGYDEPQSLPWSTKS